MSTAPQKTEPHIVNSGEWRSARLALLEKEKAFMKQKDALAHERRQLPWTRVEKDYVFESENGPIGLSEAFAGKSQLIVYHLMFGPDWEIGCKSCSFVVDHFAGTLPHLKARDTNLVCVSRGPIDRLLAFRKRMGWQFPWYSSMANSFNFDFAVSFEIGDRPYQEFEYNYAPLPFEASEMPGFSIFSKDASGQIYHSYSTYFRGVEMPMATYHLLDMTPKGRDEDDLEFSMAWVKHHDLY